MQLINDETEEPEVGHPCLEIESFAQHSDTDNNLRSVFVNKLSHRLLVLEGEITGCNGDRNAHPATTILETEDGFKLPILRCLRPNVEARSSTTTRIVLHSTDNGDTSTRLAGEVKCAIDPKRCPENFAHYYIGRDGSIVQVVKDDNKAWHVGKKPKELH